LRCLRLLLIVLLLPSISIAQPAPTPEVVLHVSGATGHSLDLTEEDLSKLPRVSVNVTTEKGIAAVYEGVAVSEILRRVDAPFGKAMRRDGMTLYLIVTASDGYRVLYALAELDPAFADRVVLLADHRDGKSLSSAEGPFRMIVPGEKLHARWIRNVTTLSLHRAN
jgi:hypothetical protein